MEKYEVVLHENKILADGTKVRTHTVIMTDLRSDLAYLCQQAIRKYIHLKPKTDDLITIRVARKRHEKD